MESVRITIQHVSFPEESAEESTTIALSRAYWRKTQLEDMFGQFLYARVFPQDDDRFPTWGQLSGEDRECYKLGIQDLLYFMQKLDLLREWLTPEQRTLVQEDAPFPFPNGL